MLKLSSRYNIYPDFVPNKSIVTDTSKQFLKRRDYIMLLLSISFGKYNHLETNSMLTQQMLNHCTGVIVNIPGNVSTIITFRMF